MAHLVCGHYLSGDEDAAFLITDGRIEHHSSIMGTVQDRRITVFKESATPIRHSLGLFYSKVTCYLGFMPNNDKYKVMRLSAFASVPAGPNPLLQRVVKLLPRGCYELSFDNVLLETQSYYRHFDRRVPHNDWDFWFRLDRWAQDMVEAVTAHQLAHLETRIFLSRLLVQGGVALNRVNNTKLLERSFFAEVCVSFGASDLGVAIGAGFYPCFLAGHRPRGANTPFFGLAYGAEDAEAALRAVGDRGALGAASAGAADRAHRSVCCGRGSWSAGSRAGWHMARAPSATGASWPTPRSMTSRALSMSGLRSGRLSGRSRPRY